MTKQVLPRNIAGPVVRGPDFWGRDADVALLWHLLDRGSVLLTGPRRHGKSSLMYCLRDRPAAGWDLLLTDVEFLETPAEFLTTLAAELLARAPIRRLLSQATKLPAALGRWVGGLLDDVSISIGDIGELKVRLRERLERPDLWPEVAGQLFGQLHGLPSPIVLIIDEFSMMMASMLAKHEEEGLRFLRWFRSCRQSPDLNQVRFLLGGSLNIEPLLERLGNEALLGDLQRMKISPLPEHEALEFIRQILEAEAHPFEPGVPEEVLHTVRTGVHYYLQVMLQETLVLARHHGRPIQVGDITVVYREKVIGPENRHRFSHYHTRLKYYGIAEEHARVVLYALCRVAEASVTELAEAVVRAGGDGRLLEDLLARLEADYYVIREGSRVRFSDGLLKDWWLRNGTTPIGHK